MHATYCRALTQLAFSVLSLSSIADDNDISALQISGTQGIVLSQATTIGPAQPLAPGTGNIPCPVGTTIITPDGVPR